MVGLPAGQLTLRCQDGAQCTCVVLRVERQNRMEAVRKDKAAMFKSHEYDIVCVSGGVDIERDIARGTVDSQRRSRKAAHSQRSLVVALTCFQTIPDYIPPWPSCPLPTRRYR